MAAHDSRVRDPDAVDIGSVVEQRYEITERLGEGGFATVFKARDQHQRGRDLALKVLHADPRLRNDPSFRARFEREARLAARIDHPNVVTILGYGLAGPLEQPFIAMEFLEGYDLAFMLEQEGRFDARRALRLLLPCLEALGRGHAQGIVHKDLKPGNLFLIHPGTSAEHMKVLDFGIARRDAPGEKRITLAGEILGTPEYLAPEYIDRAEVGPALDVYQMGLILGEMLVGYPLARSDSTIGCIITHSAGVPIPPQLAATPLRSALEAALALDPARRLRDAETLRQVLARVDPEAVELALQRAECELKPRIARPDTVPSAAFPAVDAAMLAGELETAHGIDDVVSEDMAPLDSQELGLATTIGANDPITAIGWQADPDGQRVRSKPATPPASGPERPQTPPQQPSALHVAPARPHFSAVRAAPAERRRRLPLGWLVATLALGGVVIVVVIALLAAG